MSTITGDINLCSCRCVIEAHDGFGCITQDCNCYRTSAQLQFLAQIRDSLQILMPAAV